MVYYLNYRRRCSILILFFLILFAFAAYSAGFFIQWTVLAGMWFMLILTDFMFLGDNTFIYDPNFRSWSSVADPSEFS